jgi:predicted metal-dependent enzyme (double-stranded beta helix superfamily)
MVDKVAEFGAACQKALKEKPGPAGREEVCRLLEGLLRDDEFIEGQVRADGGARRVLYEDPELGFCVLAHAYQGASESQPHDHGPSWAIYGQARGETEMTEWEVVSRPQGDQPGKVRRAKSYTLRPGMVCLYNEGQLHSPKRYDSTRLIRIEGQNMDGVRRDRFEAVP